MTITEQLKALPPDGAVTPTEKDGTLRMLPEGFPTILNANLIALAQSHERLLKLAADYRSLIESDYEGRDGIVGAMGNTYVDVLSAIGAAENL